MGESEKIMKIVFNKQKMANAVAPLMCCVDSKGTLKAVEGILIEASLPDTVTLTTFDIEKGMRITCNAEVIEEGSYIVNAQKFNQTLKVMDNETLTLSIDEKCHAVIEFGKSVHTMNALPGSDFPTIPGFESVNSFIISQSIVKEVLNKVSFAMGINNQRYVLDGCYCVVEEGKLTMVACDGFKLAKCEKYMDIENTGTGTVKQLAHAFIIPYKTVNELQRLLSSDENAKMKVYVTHKHTIFHFGDMVFFSRVVDGYYIDYDRMLMKEDKIFMTISRNKLLSALERACLITEERIIGALRASVKLDLSENILKITAVSTAGSTYDEIDVEQKGDDIFIAFNNKYLIDCVRSCGGENLMISMSSPHASINITPYDKDETVDEVYMLLPVRLND